jgi:hypothetical protein
LSWLNVDLEPIPATSGKGPKPTPGVSTLRRGKPAARWVPACTQPPHTVRTTKVKWVSAPSPRVLRRLRNTLAMHMMRLGCHWRTAASLLDRNARLFGTYRARRPLCRDRRLRARRWPRPRPRWRPPGPTRRDRPNAARIAATRSQSSTNRESATWTSPSASRKRRPVRAPVRVRPPFWWCSPRSGPRPARASRVRSLRRSSPATVRSPRPSTPRTGGTCPSPPARGTRHSRGR